MSKEQKDKKKETFINPIDPDKIAENPHILPYAHTVGGAVIKPEDRGKIRGRAMAAMYEQTDMHLGQIREQIELLARQAQDIQHRVQISEEIYDAEMGFEPIIAKVYFLYRRSNGKAVVSMVSPPEWGKNPPFKFIATVQLLSDHTWEVLEIVGDISNPK
jgi:hypothetical protein